MKGRCRCSVTEGSDRERGGSGLKATAAVRTTNDPEKTGPPSSPSPPSPAFPAVLGLSSTIRFIALLRSGTDVLPCWFLAGKGGGRREERSGMGMDGVWLQASSCFVRSSRSVLCYGLSACRCPGTESSELDDIEDDGGISRSEEAERFYQGHPSLPSMSAWTSSSSRLWCYRWRGGQHPLFFQSINECGWINFLSIGSMIECTMRREELEVAATQGLLEAAAARERKGTTARERKGAGSARERKGAASPRERKAVAAASEENATAAPLQRKGVGSAAPVAERQGAAAPEGAARFPPASSFTGTSTSIGCFPPPVQPHGACWGQGGSLMSPP
ncbi:hypothetical protein E2562_021144 [Oryza meyeriana var. granulata]|uniref:Uncharacterized protein n=1 Tax=Oryza meyeriana var. granulata TaxID=110450 RepID=A0A6G1BML6_9ORYZ|nr:hypothetical protein E2562_021144 [Oryza meyeriana var. granulata]